MRGIIWSQAATDQLDAIARYIARENPYAAARVRQRLVAATLRLADAPDVGRTAGRLYRELTVVPPYVIRYRVEPERVLIVRVRHGARGPRR